MASQNLCFFHVDAHPDLMISKTNCNDLKIPDLLYDALEKSGGISEFILPLVLNKHFSSVVWIKPCWSKQFHRGTALFSIGNNQEGMACVSSCTSYYLDEGIVEPCSNIAYSVDISFTTSTIETISEELKADKIVSNSKWILDICLDYFTTSNPFLIELESKLKECETKQSVISSIIYICSNMYLSQPFRNRKHVTHHNVNNQERNRYQHVLQDVWNSAKAFSIAHLSKCKSDYQYLSYLINTILSPQAVHHMEHGGNNTLTATNIMNSTQEFTLDTNRPNYPSKHSLSASSSATTEEVNVCKRCAIPFNQEEISFLLLALDMYDTDQGTSTSTTISADNINNDNNNHSDIEQHDVDVSATKFTKSCHEDTLMAIDMDTDKDWDRGTCTRNDFDDACTRGSIISRLKYGNDKVTPYDCISVFLNEDIITDSDNSGIKSGISGKSNINNSHVTDAHDSSDVDTCLEIEGPEGGGDEGAGFKYAVMFVILLRYLPIDVIEVLCETDLCLLSTLPHNPIRDMNIIQTSINALYEGISRASQEVFFSPPEVICISRSDEDEYTDPELVDEIQEAVQQMLHKLAQCVWREQLQNCTDLALSATSEGAHYDSKATATASKESLCTSNNGISLGGNGVEVNEPIIDVEIKYYDIRENCYVQSRAIFIDDLKYSRTRTNADEKAVASARKRKLLQESGYIDDI